MVRINININIGQTAGPYSKTFKGQPFSQDSCGFNPAVCPHRSFCFRSPGPFVGRRLWLFLALASPADPVGFFPHQSEFAGRPAPFFYGGCAAAQWSPTPTMCRLEPGGTGFPGREQWESSPPVLRGEGTYTARLNHLTILHIPHALTT